MTIFHAIKYADIDIYNENHLNDLPDIILLEWHSEIQEFLIDLLKKLLTVKTEYPIVQDTIDSLEYYLTHGLDDDELEEIIHSITKDILRDPERSSNDPDVILSHCVLNAYYAMTSAIVAPDAISTILTFILPFCSHHSVSDFNNFFKNRLMILLSEFDN